MGGAEEDRGQGRGKLRGKRKSLEKHLQSIAHKDNFLLQLYLKVAHQMVHPSPGLNEGHHRLKPIHMPLMQFNQGFSEIGVILVRGDCHCGPQSLEVLHMARLCTVKVSRY